MTELHQTPVRQKPSPLPALPLHDILTPEQWSILAAIADTVVPSLTRSEGNRLLQHPLQSSAFDASSKRLDLVIHREGDVDLVTSYLGESATAQPDFRRSISRLVNLHLHQDARKGLLFILNTLK